MKLIQLACGVVLCVASALAISAGTAHTAFAGINSGKTSSVLGGQISLLSPQAIAPPSYTPLHSGTTVYRSFTRQAVGYETIFRYTQGKWSLILYQATELNPQTLRPVVPRSESSGPMFGKPAFGEYVPIPNFTQPPRVGGYNPPPPTPPLPNPGPPYPPIHNPPPVENPPPAPPDGNGPGGGYAPPYTGYCNGNEDSSGYGEKVVYKLEWVPDGNGGGSWQYVPVGVTYQRSGQGTLC